MRLLLIAGAALAVLVSTIWLASSSEETGTRFAEEPSPSPSEDEDREAAEPDPQSLIEDVLDQRAQAVRDDDRRSFLASIDPSAGRFRRQQRQSFERVTSLRLGAYDLELVEGSDLTKQRHEGRYRKAEDVMILRVEERYRFKRFDDGDFITDLALTFVLRNGDWLLASDGDVKGKAATGRSIWEFGPIKKTRSRDVLVLQHPCDTPECVEVGDRFLQLAETGLDKVSEKWREPWNERVVVLVTASDEELRAILGIDFAIENFVAFAFAPNRARGYSPARIVVNRESLSGRSPEDILAVMTHELMHVATRRISGPHVPLWVEEGLAEWVARAPGDDGDIFFDSQLSTGEVVPELPRDRDFRRGSADDLFARYQSSRFAVTYFIDRFGYRKFVRFYKILGDSHEQPGNARKHLQSSLRRVTGLSPRTFEMQWTDSIAP